MAFDNITELAILTFQIPKIRNDVLVNEKLDICIAISILGLLGLSPSISITEYYRVLQGIEEYCRVLQSAKEFYRVLQSIA